MATLILFFLILITTGLLIIGCKKTALTTIIFTIFYLLIVGCGLLPTLLLNHLESPYKILQDPHWAKRNLIILLGNGASKEVATNTALPSIMSYARIYEAARLYFSCQKSGNICLLLISGGDAAKIGSSEAVIYGKALNALGINNSNILLESQSMNTYKNAELTSALLKGKTFDQLFLVTSSYHLTRALLYFAHFGLHAIPAPADYLKAYFSPLPLGYNFAACDTALHEYFGIIRFYFSSNTVCKKCSGSI